MARILTIEEATHDVIPGKRGKKAKDFSAIVAEVAAMKAGEGIVEAYSAAASITNKKGTGFLDRFTAAAAAAKPVLAFTAKVTQGASGRNYVTITKSA